MEAARGTHPPSQSGCDDALLWRLKRDVFKCYLPYKQLDACRFSFVCLTLPKLIFDVTGDLRNCKKHISVWLSPEDAFVYYLSNWHLAHRSHVSFLSQFLCLTSNPRSVSFSVPHTFSLPSCPPVLPLLSLSAQADRKCQVRPGYFRPNWEIDVPLETWHLDMPFILPHALPPKRREPDMMTARWNTDNCPFLRTLFSQSEAGMTPEWKISSGGGNQNCSEGLSFCLCWPPLSPMMP